MLSIGRPKSPVPNNNTPLVTPPQKDANNLGPLSSTNILEDMFPDPKYRSHVFFIKQYDKVVGIRKVALRKDGEIFRSTVTELKAYKQLLKQEDWRKYILPFREGNLLGHGKTVYIDFDYVNGMDLVDFSKSASRAEVHRILASVAKALAFCFKAGLTHGDIKGDNIYITKKGKVLLFDFGEATIDPKQRDQENDLEAYIALCKALLNKSPAVDTDLDKRGLDDIYTDFALFWSSQKGGAMRTRKSLLKRKSRFTRK
jgi:hypothetical protein